MERIAGVIEVYDDAIPNASTVLDAVLAGGDDWAEALVGPQATSKRREDIRDSYVKWINPFDFRIDPILYGFAKTVWGYIDEYGQRYDQGFSSLETINVNRYLPGEQYHVHADAGGKSMRVISALVYLNDDFIGGETEFVHFDERVTPRAGRLVIFPSNYAYAHAALPPTDGVKYSAAFWVNA